MPKFWWVYELRANPKFFLSSLWRYIVRREWRNPTPPYIWLLAIGASLSPKGTVTIGGQPFSEVVKALIAENGPKNGRS